MEGFQKVHVPEIEDDSKPRAVPDFGYIHSVIMGAAVDGPGMRYLIFMAGCAFRCLYCHNPDTWKVNAGQRKSMDQVMAEIAKYAVFLKRAGGVTISGGEPLTQASFVGELFRLIKERWGLHNALDTQGHLAARLPDSWFDPVDLVLLDIKHIDEEKHKALTGFPLKPTLDCARRLSDMGKDMWIRHVVVPGWTDSLDDARRLADFVAGLATVRRVEILPFHQMGANKWRELGIPYALENTPIPGEELVESIRLCFRERGLETY